MTEQTNTASAEQPIVTSAADEQGVIKRVEWTSIFSFTQIFKSFKMTMKLWMLLLGLGVLVLIWGGGHVMDTVWGVMGVRAMPNEIMAHVQQAGPEFRRGKDAWDDAEKKLMAAAQIKAEAMNSRHNLTGWKTKWRSLATSAELETVITDELKKYNDSSSEAKFQSANWSEILKTAQEDGVSWSTLLADAEEEMQRELEKVEDILDDAYDLAEEQIEKNANSIQDEDAREKQIDQAEETLDRAYASAYRAMTLRKLEFLRKKESLEGTGVFKAWFAWQGDCVRNAMVSLWHLNFRGGLTEYMDLAASRGTMSAGMETSTGLPGPSSAAPANQKQGFLFYVLLAVEGCRWMVCQYPVYGVIFLLWSLLAWAWLGGAMYRIAALLFAREEAIDFRQALAFSRGKLASFFVAPVVPLVAIVLVGLLLTVGGLVGSIPVVGTILMSILYGLAILLGFGMTFLLVGWLGGVSLMYPTIAVEGSDCFDAFSRSFSFVYTRPFRALWYGAVMVVYGMITYLFVRLFAFLALSLTHCFTSWGVLGGGSRLGQGADKLDILWQKPTFWNFYLPNWAAMGTGQSIAAVLLGIWVMIVVGLVAAYLLGFFVSATTAIYYILRRRVDATELDEVYVEEEEEPLPPMEDSAAEESASDAQESQDSSEQEDSKTEDASEDASTNEDAKDE